MISDNYELIRKQWQNRISGMNIDTLLNKLPFLNLQQDRLEISYLGSSYSISLTDGSVHRTSHPDPIPIYDELNILTLLWYCKDHAVLSGNWVSFPQLKNAAPFGPAFTAGTLKPFAEIFANHAVQLEQALLALGGQKLSTADVGYEVAVFPCMPVQVMFWDADEEFPAQLNLLFDANATDFIHVESIVTIGSQLLRHLAEHANLLNSETAGCQGDVQQV